MKRPRFPRRWLVPLGALLLPPLAWSLLIAVMPTEWARARVVARLEAATGRPVALGALRVGLLGGLVLRDLAVATPGKAADPWLKISSARLNVSIVQLLCGQIDPTDLEVAGLSLRVHRRADGTYEMADSSLATSAAAGQSPARASHEPSGLNFRLTGGSVTVLDPSNGTRLELTGVEGRGTWEGRRTTVQEIRGTLNGGTFVLAAQLDRSGPAPAFEGQFKADGVALDSRMALLGYLTPIAAGAGAPGREGRLNLNLYLRGTGTSRADLKRTLVGRGAVTLDPVKLDGSPLIAELADALRQPAGMRIGAVRSTITIRDGRVNSDDLTIDCARFPVVLTGWTDFDGRLDYRLRADRLAGRLSEQAKEFLSELEINPAEAGTLAVHGSLGHVVVTVNGQPPRQFLGSAADRERKFRGLSRRLKDRLLR